MKLKDIKENNAPYNDRLEAELGQLSLKLESCKRAVDLIISLDDKEERAKYMKRLMTSISQINQEWDKITNKLNSGRRV